MLFYFISCYFLQCFEPAPMLRDFEWHRAINKMKMHNHKTQKLNTEAEYLRSEHIETKGLLNPHTLTFLMNINIPEATMTSTERECSYHRGGLSSMCEPHECEVIKFLTFTELGV